MTELAAPPRTLDVDDAAIDAVAARLDLREPNREALRSLAYTLSQHYDVEGRPPPFEAVVDAATGVGKTYVVAAAIEYFAERGHRNFAVVTPGRTILEKTIANFTPGHPKSLLAGMEVEPLIVTAENFATVDHAEPDRVKLYVFTVQSLVRPTGKQGKRVHTFHESLGDEFYAYLESLGDLLLFADEHHVYYGPAFSDAIRTLRPHALVGLTATPHKKTPREQIIYRYPLAAAIADELVKTPVLVGRKDDRGQETLTKLQDAMRLLEAKRTAMEKWCPANGLEPVNPVLLVIAQTIGGAEEVADLVRQPSFFDGRYADAVLTVHSKAPDEALAALDQVEDPGSPVRIIVSVGMLKEGWDVKNVYAICSLRPLLSDVLTEQTLGRGLRLPWGRYTGVRLLDTLEVLAHDRYDALLKKTSAINEEFVDYRTRIVVRLDAEGNESAHVETTKAEVDVTTEEGAVGAVAGEDQETREAKAETLAEQLVPRDDLPPLVIPRLRMTKVSVGFSLADIVDLEPFRQLGRRLAMEPEDELRRMELGARIVTGKDGLRHTELVTTTGDPVVSAAAPIPLDEARERLLDAVLGAEIVPPREREAKAAAQIVAAFVKRTRRRRRTSPQRVHRSRGGGARADRHGRASARRREAPVRGGRRARALRADAARADGDNARPQRRVLPLRRLQGLEEVALPSGVVRLVDGAVAGPDPRRRATTCCTGSGSSAATCRSCGRATAASTTPISPSSRTTARAGSSRRRPTRSSRASRSRGKSSPRCGGRTTSRSRRGRSGATCSSARRTSQRRAAPGRR